jgi:AraC-like DNA-binding protein
MQMRGSCYLLRWRMRLAARALRESDASISSIAGNFGYEAESAFSSTFKRVMGMAPRHYRNKRQPGLVLPLRKNLDQYDLEQGNPSPSK